MQLVYFFVLVTMFAPFGEGGPGGDSEMTNFDMHSPERLFLDVGEACHCRFSTTCLFW